MAEYDIRTDVKYGPLERIDVAGLAGLAQPWFNQTLCRVNDPVIRLGVVEGEFHWHKHDVDDEFFYVAEGARDRPRRQAASVSIPARRSSFRPAGFTVRAPMRTVILMAATAQVRRPATTRPLPRLLKARSRGRRSAVGRYAPFTSRRLEYDQFSFAIRVSP